MIQSPSEFTLIDFYEKAGSKKKLLKKLLGFIEVNYKPVKTFKYTAKTGWTLFVRKSGKPLFYVNLNEEIVNVTIVIGESLSDKVNAANLSKKTKEMFKNAYQFHDGKWLNFNVQDETDIEDIKNLVIIKKPF